MGDFPKPLLIGAEFFDALDSGLDPAEKTAAGNRVAELLVRGPRVSNDADIVERVLTLADDEGLCSIAELWATALPDSLAGALWRLYLLRAWVHNEPNRAAHEFNAGRHWVPVDEVLAGVQDPPGPREVSQLADDVIRGAVRSDVDVAFDRAAAFAHIVAVGRAHIAPEHSVEQSVNRNDAHSAAKLMEMAGHLRQAARLERAGKLA